MRDQSPSLNRPQPTQQAQHGTWNKDETKYLVRPSFLMCANTIDVHKKRKVSLPF